MRGVEDKGFLLLLLVATLAFVWIVEPFYGAVLWAIVAAVIFAPLNRALVLRLQGRANLAALITLLIIVGMVILPLGLIGASLARETTGLFTRVQSGEFDFAGHIQRVLDALPHWLTDLLNHFELTDLSSLRDALGPGLMRGGQLLAPQALSIGMNTFDFVISFGIMLYLLFFLLRDGKALVDVIRAATPLRADQRAALFSRFADVVRATVKGGILVAMAQGALGGLAFWFLGIRAALLWAVLMTVLSLLPAVGASLVWLPVALYLMVSGSLWQGIGLVLYGVLVIGLIDNILRPILVGKGTRLPDYIVLLSTLGGIKVFGLNGFVIGPLIAAIFMVSWEIFITERPAPGDGKSES